MLYRIIFVRFISFAYAQRKGCVCVSARMYVDICAMYALPLSFHKFCRLWHVVARGHLLIFIIIEIINLSFESRRGVNEVYVAVRQHSSSVKAERRVDSDRDSEKWSK